MHISLVAIVIVGCVLPVTVISAVNEGYRMRYKDVLFSDFTSLTVSTAFVNLPSIAISR